MELLYVPARGGYIALEPARGVAFKLNPKAHAIARNLLRGARPTRGGPETEAVLTRLRELERIPVQRIRGDHPRPLSQLVLLLTSDCNMRCVYCYSTGGRDKVELSTAATRGAIDFVVANLVSNQLKRLNLSFHGGGEPTLAWNTLVDAYEYARTRCEDRGLHIRTRLTSNGLWSEAQAEWIASHLDSVLLSIDGPEDVMRAHRPTVNGVPALPVIRRSIDTLRRHGQRIRIRATISRQTVGRLSECVDWFASLGAVRVQLEPLTVIGRAQEAGVSRPGAREFCSRFLEAVAAGRRTGCEVVCSYVRPMRYGSEFCAALGRVFILSPFGWVSTCHRIARPADQGGGELLVGKVDRESGRVLIDRPRVERLLRARGHRPRKCRECPAKYSCSGGCYSQNATISGNVWFPDSYRCAITRTLTTAFLNASVDARTA